MNPTSRHLLVPCAYESDGSGAVSLANVLFLAEEARVAFTIASLEAAIPYPTHQLARVQRLVLHESIPTSVEVAIEVFLSRIGRTSFDVAHRFVSTSTGRTLADVVGTFVSTDGRGGKLEVDPSLASSVVPFAIDALAEPDVEAPADAFGLTFPVLPSDENRGGHASHARIAEHLEDVRRLAGLRGALRDPSDVAARPCRAITVVYDREARFGDELDARVVTVDRGLADAVLRDARTGELVARARMAFGS